MSPIKVLSAGLLLISLLTGPIRLPDADAKQFRVLAVMSYEQDYPWVTEIRNGIESVLKDTAQIDYFYLNTKIDWNGGPRRAKQAFALFNAIQPDGVIVADDDGQAMFVVPYLKGRVDTPVVFCGVNAEPEAYGYPAINVTGVLEREPMKQSLLFLTQLVPSVQTFGLIIKESPTARAVERQLAEEREGYPVKYVGAREARSMPEARDIIRAFKPKCDALVYITMQGLPDAQGKPLSDKDILPELAADFGKPIITNALYRVKYSALSAVVKTGQEHGTMAARMLLDAMRGTPVADLPVTRNRFGLRVINVDTMVALGITPKPALIRSATLVRNE